MSHRAGPKVSPKYCSAALRNWKDLIVCSTFVRPCSTLPSPQKHLLNQGALNMRNKHFVWIKGLHWKMDSTRKWIAGLQVQTWYKRKPVQWSVHILYMYWKVKCISLALMFFSGLSKVLKHERSCLSVRQDRSHYTEVVFSFQRSSFSTGYQR